MSYYTRAAEGRDNHSYLTEEDLVRLRDLRASGAKARLIAKTIGCSLRTVYVHIRRNGQDLGRVIMERKRYEERRRRALAAMDHTEQLRQASNHLQRKISMHHGPWYLDDDGCMTRVVMTNETRRMLDDDAARRRYLLDHGVERDTVADGSGADAPGVLDRPPARDDGPSGEIPGQALGSSVGGQDDARQTGADGEIPSVPGLES